MKKKNIVIKDMQDTLNDIFMAQVCSPRKQELADSRMIQEDHNAIANLPQHSISKLFNPWKYEKLLDKDDGISGK